MSQKKKLSAKDSEILNLEKISKDAKAQEKYSIELEAFADKFRDGVKALERRVKAFKFEEATQLSYQIKREARELELVFIENSLAPIVGIEKTQNKQFEKSLKMFCTIV